MKKIKSHRVFLIAASFFLLASCEIKGGIQSMFQSSSSIALSLTEGEKTVAEAMDVAKTVDLSVQTVDAYQPTGSYQGIQAITFDALPIAGRKTKVFAYLALPKAASKDHPVPAIVLVHGGGGHPFLEWMTLWLNRGYAAIALETTGYFPTAVNAGDSETSSAWKRELVAPFAAEGYALQPDNDGMQHSLLPIDQQWMYHALADTLIASRIIASQEGVDANKVGIMGISWGGVITSLALTFYPYAFALPIYGSGYLDEALSYQGKYFSNPATQNLWLAQHRFAEAQMPILWQGWNADNNFSINSISKSYGDTAKINGRTRLSLVNNMLHSHSIAWGREEPYYFADTVCFGKAELPSFTANSSSERQLSWHLDYDETAFSNLSVKAYYLTSPLAYDSSSTIAVAFTGLRLGLANHEITGSLPAEAVAYYLEVKVDLNGANGFVSSPFIEL
jgi:dienelactone hydrolase